LIVHEIVVFYEANKYTCHAEKDAILKIKDKNILKKCKIYIGRYKYGTIETATPCSMCTKLLKKYGIKKIYILS
jgi:deoxycytidylate deaminase